MRAAHESPRTPSPPAFALEQVEALLDEATQYIQRIAKSMWKGGSVPTQLSAESTIAHLESWMKLLDARVMQVRFCRARNAWNLPPILTDTGPALRMRV